MEPERLLKCKLPGCKTNREGVQVYSNAEGNMKFNLCVNCRKLPFGMALIPYTESDKSIKKLSDDKNATAKKRADDAADRKAEVIGMCQYPSCVKEGCKLWVTKAPHPITRLHKGRYCEFHRDVLNSDNRVLPYRYGRVMEIVTDYALTLRPVNYVELAHKEGVTPKAVRVMFRTAVLAAGHDVAKIEVNDRFIRLTSTEASTVRDTTPEAPGAGAQAEAPEGARRETIVTEMRSEVEAGRAAPEDLDRLTSALQEGR